MLHIISGLAEGQVIQRVTANQANLLLNLAGKSRGPLTVTLLGKNKAPVKGWSKRQLGTKTKEKVAVKILGIPVGGPYQLILECGGASAKISSFLAGDVWMLGGQSNMEGNGLIQPSSQSHPLIRAFSMRREWRLAKEPLHHISESPDACHNGGNQCTPAESENFRRVHNKGAGPALYFAHEMLKRSGVPQGLICTAHGGTSMTDWTPEPIRNGEVSVYGSALASLKATHQPIAGILWYQGESDANDDAAPLYTKRMKLLVKSFRRDLRQPTLPWIMVQIGTDFGPSSANEEKNWTEIQEQQRLLPNVIPHLGVVASIDLTLDDNIHISGEGHEILASRLAREADRLVYKNRRETLPPSLKSIIYKKHLVGPDAKRFGVSPMVQVAFNHVGTALQSNGVPNGFTVIDEEGKNLRGIFKTTLHKNEVWLHLHTAFNISSARLSYGYGRIPICNILDGRGHSLPVFGPKPLGKPQAYLPFIKTWKVTQPVPMEKKLDQLKTPPTDIPSELITYGENEFHLDGFINEHPRWMKHYGLAFFSSTIQLSEPMRLEFLTGYDGPFRLWIDGKSFFINMGGTNPCLPDESGKTITLGAGTHRVDVGMDINRGNAWGFFVRMIRKDITSAQVKSGDFAKPVYSV